MRPTVAYIYHNNNNQQECVAVSDTLYISCTGSLVYLLLAYCKIRVLVFDKSGCGESAFLVLVTLREFIVYCNKFCISTLTYNKMSSGCMFLQADIIKYRYPNADNKYPPPLPSVLIV